jgi:hypothetical protein
MEYFFSLFSLSKSGTSTALNCSEVALLLFGVILVIGIVGEEVERWEHRKKLFVALVIVGVAGELFADGGIFLFSHQLQVISDTEIAAANKNAGDAKTSANGAADDAGRAKGLADQANADAKAAKKLADAVADRASKLAKEQRATAKSQEETAKAQSELAKHLDTIAKRQADRRVDGGTLVKLLKGKPKKRVEILYNPNDSEAWALAQEIFWWLGDGPSKNGKGAGWDVLLPSPIPDTGMPGLVGLANAPLGMRFFGSMTTAGIEFRTRQLTPDLGSALGELTTALKVSIFGAAPASFSETQDPSLPDDLIVVVVLHKPTWFWGLEKP